MFGAGLAGAGDAAAAGPILAIDADPSGNTASHVEKLNSCVSVANGTTFKVDIVVTDVNELLAWEAYLQYDQAVLMVTQRDVKQFQAVKPGASVIDLSAKVPDRSGQYHLAAADTADPPNASSGSGILARITLQAIGSGASKLSVAKQPDRGPLLRDVDGKIIANNGGDPYFDGETRDAQVAVDRPCPKGTDVGQPFPGDSSGGGSLTFEIAALALAAAAALFAGVMILLYRRRSGAQSN